MLTKKDIYFINWQDNVNNTIIFNDDFIKDNIKYNKHINLITNQYIINYLQNRFKDSSSLLETYQRIKLGIEEKPKCLVCGKPVNWIGKKSKLYTTYCSNTCSANSDISKMKKRESLSNSSEITKQKIKEKYGVEYISQIPEVIDKRKQTLLNKYGTTNLYNIDGVIEKINKTNQEKYGVDWVFQKEDIRNKIYESYKKTGTSKRENIVYQNLIKLGYNVTKQKTIKNTNWAIDFYLDDFDIYIEYQGSQFHHGRSYLGTQEDLIEVNKLKEKDNYLSKINNRKSQYSEILKTWAERDVKKRNWMFEHNYKFLELYDCLTIDSLNNQLNIFINSFKIKDKNHQLYATNPIIRRMVIQNCCKILNKKESELTEDDIFNNFIY